MHETRMKTGRYMQNVYPFTTFRRFMPEKKTIFLDFANSRLRLKKYLFFAKVGTNVVYVLIGSGGRVHSFRTLLA